MRYDKHIFICTNQRAEGHQKGCCQSKGAEEVRALFKKSMKERGLNLQMRANAAGCLDACEHGVTAVVYPDAVWYGGITVDDVEEIIESHLIGDQPVERLLIREPRYTHEPISGMELPDSKGDPSTEPDKD